MQSRLACAGQIRHKATPPAPRAASHKQRNIMSRHVYDPTVVEQKWQKWWDENKTNEIDLKAAENPFYVLMMFPYPSAEGLHVGNVYAFTGADVYGRHRRLRGYDVFEPIGFDAFGIHSENFAMKVNRHPRELIPSNVANFTRQLKMMGFMFDWRRTVDTTSPEYYKWTQWVFLQLYKAGLVYRDIKEVNFCPECGTVISDEQVNTDGTCERHGDTMVERRKMPCWFFRITKFAGQLLDNHDWLDWSETTNTAQRNWIGRSKGAEVDFAVSGADAKIRVFTTRPDTLFGATFMVLAVDHPLVDQIASEGAKNAIAEYRAEAAAKKEAAKAGAPEEEKEKTGVDIGATAINPCTGKEIPIYISDYVLMEYGTGAIMAVPAHDERDFAFAQKFDLPIVPVINPDPKALAEFASVSPDEASRDGKSIDEIRLAVMEGKLCWSGPGLGINSANDEVSLDGLKVAEAKERITIWLKEQQLGEYKETYRLRDWGISRQRYWGPPLPIIYDEDGNPHPVPEDQLPVALPDLEDFRPSGDGRGPLATAEDWVNTTLSDGRPGRRETDVMDNFLDSAWYYLRYISSGDDTQAYDPELVRKWLPVDVYIGGNEHAVLHLMYTRFICMGLVEAGVLKMKDLPDMKDPSEPFRKFRAHGLLIKDGAKMSKSKGNVVNPDLYVEKWGADTLRMYLMFLGPFVQGGDFQDDDIVGIRRFLNRLYQWYNEESTNVVEDDQLPRGLRVKVHQTIKKVRDDIDGLNYNTAIAAIMELFNEVRAAKQTSDFIRDSIVLMLAPFAPYFVEEIWQGPLGKSGSIWNSKAYPEFKEELTVLDEVEIVVQINGKIRDRLSVSSTATKDEIEKLAMEHEKVIAALNGGTPKRLIVVPGRLVNVII